MESLIQWVLDNWEVFKTNWKLFVGFGVLCCAATIAVQKYIYDNFLYKDLPEKQALQDQIDELSNKNNKLRAQNDSLMEAYRNNHANDIFLNGITSEETKSAGELIAEAIPQQ